MEGPPAAEGVLPSSCARPECSRLVARVNRGCASWFCDGSDESFAEMFTPLSEMCATGIANNPPASPSYAITDIDARGHLGHEVPITTCMGTLNDGFDRFAPIQMGQHYAVLQPPAGQRLHLTVTEMYLARGNLRFGHGSTAAASGEWQVGMWPSPSTRTEGVGQNYTGDIGEPVRVLYVADLDNAKVGESFDLAISCECVEQDSCGAHGKCRDGVCECSDGYELLNGECNAADGSPPAPVPVPGFEGFFERYTLSGCSMPARCGTYTRVLANCIAGRGLGCAGGGGWRSNGNNTGSPSLCDGVPVYQLQHQGGSGAPATIYYNDGPVLYRAYDRILGTQWCVGNSERLADCSGDACILRSAPGPYHAQSSLQGDPGQMLQAPPTAAAYSNGEVGWSGHGWFDSDARQYGAISILAAGGGSGATRASIPAPAAPDPCNLECPLGDTCFRCTGRDGGQRCCPRDDTGYSGCSPGPGGHYCYAGGAAGGG